MRTRPIILVLASVALLSACAHPNPQPSARDTAALALRIGGGVLAAGGPAVAIAGIALDDRPTTPPVEAFVLGGALCGAGVAAVIAGGVLAEPDAPHS